MLTWIFPGILWGTAAASAPLIIHLLLRPRPRLQTFPALRLLQTAQKRTARQRQLRHLLLLLSRMAILALLAFALARPVWRGSTLAGGPRRPTSAVICIDDSLSMHYRYQNATRLDQALDSAAALLRDTERFPIGSRVMVIFGSDDRPAAWNSDPSIAERQIKAHRATEHDRGVDDLLNRARTALEKRIGTAAENVAEVYLFTDQTESAWRGVVPTGMSDAAAAQGNAPQKPADDDADAERTAGPIYDRFSLFIFDLGADENRNARVRVNWPGRFQPAPGRFIAPPGRPITFDVTVEAADESITGQLELWINSTIVARSGRVDVAAGDQQSVAVTMPPRSPGECRCEVRLDRNDALPEDNVAVFALEVPARLAVGLVVPEHMSERGDEIQRLATMIAPAHLPIERRSVELTIIPAARFAEQRLNGYSLLVWPEPQAPQTVVAGRLAEWCRSGGTLLWIGGPGVVSPQWAQAENGPAAAILPGIPESVIDSIGGLTFEDAATGGGDASLWRQALKLNRVLQHVRFRASPDARVTLSYSDGTPAVLERAVGEGRAIWWSFSLRPGWSDLGIRAAAVLTRLHELAMRPSGGGRIANVMCSAPLRFSMEAQSNAANAVLIDRVLIERLGGDPDAERDYRDIRGGEFAAPTGTCGLYRVTAAPRSGNQSDQPVVASYAVTANPNETDGRRLADSEVMARVRRGSSAIIRHVDELSAPALQVAGDRELDGVLLLLVMALFAAETLLARRALRSAVDPVQTATSPRPKASAAPNNRSAL